MKKINLDEIAAYNRRVNHYDELLKNEIAARGRKKSENSLKKADAEIAYLREAKADNAKRLAVLVAEAEEAKKMAADGGEIVLARVWLDDYGREDSEVNRSLWKSLEEAEAVYSEAKAGNGGYIKAWIEVRAAGEYERIKAIKEKIAALEAELKELGGE